MGAYANVIHFGLLIKGSVIVGSVFYAQSGPNAGICTAHAVTFVAHATVGHDSGVVCLAARRPEPPGR